MQHRIRLQNAQTIQSVHRRHPRFRQLGLGRQFPERSDSRSILTLIQQSRGGIAMPTVCMLEGGNQFGSRGLAKLGQFWLFEFRGQDAIDPI